MKTNTFNRKGFGLVELLVSVTLSVFIAAGAYKMLNPGLTNTLLAFDRVDKKIDLDQGLDFIAHKLRNTVSLRHSTSSTMRSATDLRCSQTPLSSGILAFPERNHLQLMSLSIPEIHSSVSLSQDASTTSDAIRFIYFPDDSQEIPLANHPRTKRVYPTRGNVPIVLVSQGNLNVGDFAMIYDEFSNDVFRITGIQRSEGKVSIFHSADVSIWNRLFSENYGVSDSGQNLIQVARVRKVNPITIAHSLGLQEMVIDDHVDDDGFNPSKLSFNGQPRYQFSWNTFLKHIERLRVVYFAKDEFGQGIRNPRVGSYGRTNHESKDQGAKCGNQLGYPYLNNIKLELLSEGKSYERSVSIDSIQHTASNSDEMIGIQPPTPTPSPSPTPDPCPNGYTTTFTNSSSVGSSYYCSSDAPSCTQICTYVPDTGTPTPTPTPFVTATPSPSPTVTPPRGGGGSF